MTEGAGRLRIAWFGEPGSSEQGSETSLSAYCSELLLERLSKHLSIEVFSETPRKISESLASRHYLTAYSRHREQPFDLFFYQLEDGRRNRWSRMHLGLIPGIVWVHDLVLLDRGPEGLYTSPWERTIEQFNNATLDFIGRHETPHQLWPQAIREVSLSPVVLFSSRAALAEFRNFLSNRIEAYPGGQSVDYLPVPVEGGDVARSQGALNGEGKKIKDRLVLGFAGAVSVEDRAHKILPALRDAQCEVQLRWLVGDNEVPRACELISEFSVIERVELVQGRSFESWMQLLEGIDVAIHARRSPFGHLGPLLHSSLAAGKVVVVCDSGEGRELPKDIVFSVVPGMFESAEFRALFEQLAASSLESLGNRGREYILAESEVALVADKLLRIMRESVPAMRECLNRWRALEERAAQSLLQEVLGLAGVGDNTPEALSAEQILLPVARELGWGGSNICMSLSSLSSTPFL